MRRIRTGRHAPIAFRAHVIDSLVDHLLELRGKRRESFAGFADGL